MKTFAVSEKTGIVAAFGRTGIEPLRALVLAGQDSTPRRDHSKTAHREVFGLVVWG